MIPCAVLGATGAVGQRFVERLAGHPLFKVTDVAASAQSEGRRYGAIAWHQETPIPDAVANLTLKAPHDLHDSDAQVVFSALPSAVARPIESSLPQTVFTNASAHRMDPDVPLLIPEVNPDHMSLAKRGGIIANGNCSGIILTLALAPLHRTFGIEEVHVTTLQGLSGAGYPGVPALDVVDNVLPYIPWEEEKLDQEPQKTLGTLAGDRVEPAPFAVHATATRVPVREGHLESVHVRLVDDASLDEVREALRSFRGPEEVRGLPSAPDAPILVTDATDRPQPRRDRYRSEGMAVTVGRLRLSGRDLRMVVLGHNTIRGAAGQSILNAEYAAAIGLI